MRTEKETFFVVEEKMKKLEGKPVEGKSFNLSTYKLWCLIVFHHCLEV